MELVDVLKKVHLGGINDICVVESDGSVAVADEANVLFTYFQPSDSFEELEEAIGIRDLSTFVRVLSDLRENGSVTVEVDKVVAKDEEGTINLRLADIDSIATVDGPKEVIAEIAQELKVSATLKVSELDWVRHKYDKLKPESVVMELTKSKLSCFLGEETIGHTGLVEFGCKVKSEIRRCSSTYKADYLMSILGSIKSKKVAISFGDKKPLIIKETFKGSKTTWLLSPHDFITD